MSSGWTRVDDIDSRIIYQGYWKLGGIKGEFNKTVHGAINASNSSASFNFNGRQIKIAATLDPRNSQGPNPVFDIYIDGRLLNNYKPNIVKYAQQVSIYSSPILDDRDHTLLINNRINATKTIWLDYFDILSLDPTASTQFLSTSLTSAHLPSDTQLESSSGTPSPKSLSLSVGGIVGITLGVIGLLVLILILVFLLWRRSKKQTRQLKGEDGKYFY
ncbi:hypothetical protein K435DRAFT_802554 [Dendrothele bispora CBS 962.96]|uniref:Uncharacterized protein n=1 Tax=Dendrothele bispora (strain CBS 962.96) TaxID=1314807 RepID=A0A4S8LKH7_DENBC|nr:hypothetical protein K435DRAFT_802554 [Dendrothele bispora CBS 962.96]